MTTYAVDTHTGDGSTVNFGVSFDFIQRSHVTVARIVIATKAETPLTVITSGSPTGNQYAWVNDEQITVGTPPTADEEIRILRDTPENDQIVDWQDGSYIIAEDLNTSDKQWLYNIQELEDQLTLLDGSVVGEAVKQVTGVEPVLVDNTDDQKPIVSVDQTVSTDDPNSLTSDTTLLSEKAVDDHFKQHIGTGPVNGTKVGQIRIDNTASPQATFWWNGTAWIALSTEGQKGDKGDPGPAPGLQDPSATATNIALKPDGSVGDATAVVSQDAESDLQFQFGIPIGEKGEKGDQGDKGDPGDGVTYLGPIDATTAAEPADPQNGDFYVNTADGTSSWTGLSAVTKDDRLVWNEGTSQWDRFTPTNGSDLAYVADPAKGTVTNTNGSGFDIPLADSVNAGLLSPADKDKLETDPTLQKVLDAGNTSTTDLWIGDAGQAVKLLKTGDIEVSSKAKSASTVESDPDTTLVTKDYVDAIKAGAEVSGTPPTDPAEGDLWWADTDEDNGGGRLYVWTGNEWVDISIPGGGFSGDYNDLSNKPNIPDGFDLEDGSEINNLIVWRSEGEALALTLDDGAIDILNPANNTISYTDMPTTTDGSGTGMTVNYVATNNGTVSQLKVAFPGSNYAPGDTFTVTDRGFGGTIDSTSSDVGSHPGPNGTSGWYPEVGSDYYLSTRKDTIVNSSPKFLGSTVFGTRPEAETNLEDGKVTFYGIGGRGNQILQFIGPGASSTVNFNFYRATTTDNGANAKFTTYKNRLSGQEKNSEFVIGGDIQAYVDGAGGKVFTVADVNSNGHNIQINPSNVTISGTKTSSPLKFSSKNAKYYFFKTDGTTGYSINAESGSAGYVTPEDAALASNYDAEGEYIGPIQDRVAELTQRLDERDQQIAALASRIAALEGA